jgi:hypothetical protein
MIVKVDWSAAEQALIDAGAAKPCADHFDIILRVDDKEAERHAYAIGTNMMKFGNVRRGSRQEFMAEIAHTHANLDDVCFICRAANQVR